MLPTSLSYGTTLLTCLQCMQSWSLTACYLFYNEIRRNSRRPPDLDETTIGFADLVARVSRLRTSLYRYEPWSSDL